MEETLLPQDRIYQKKTEKVQKRVLNSGFSCICTILSTTTEHGHWLQTLQSDSLGYVYVAERPMCGDLSTRS